MRQQIRIDSLSLFWFCILSLLLNECLSSQQTPPDSHQIENWFQIAQSELNRLGTQKLLLRNQNQNINTNNNLILNSNNNNGVNNVNNNNNNNQINSVVFEQTPPFQPLPSSSFFTPEQKLFLEQQLLNSNQLSNELSSAGVIRSKQNNDQANDFANLLLTVSKNLSPPIENNVNQIPPHGKQGGQDQGLLQHEQLSAPSPEKLIQSWDSYWMKGGQGSLGQFGTPTWDGKFPGGSPLNWKGVKIPPDQTKQQPDISRKGVPFSGTTRVDDMGPMPPAKDNQGLIRQASLLGCGCDPDDKTPGSDSSPVPRYGHVTTLRISEDCFNLVVHGGMDEEEALLYDIWEYNFQTKTWCEHIPKGKSNPSNPQATRFNPGPRMNHTGYMIDHNLIVIAGHNGLKTLKDIWEYDLVRDEWIRRLVLNGGDPPDRENAMGWTFAGNAYVYGGISTYVSGALGDLWRWNNEICEWKKIEAIDGNAPEPRYGATYGMYELVYMFGGKTNKQYYNDLWTWDPITNNWAELVPFVTDVVPVGRYLAAGALKSEYFVYGGISYQGVSLNDLWGFDVVLRTWRQVKSKGTNPPDLHLHSSFLYLQGFCIHGGKGEGGINPNIYCFDPATSQWTTVYSE